MDCWGDVTTPAGASREVEVDPRDVPAVGGRALPRRRADRRQRHSRRAASRRRCASRSASCRRARSCSAWRTPSCSTTRSPARARTTPPRRRRSTWTRILEHGDAPFDAAFMQADLRALLGLRAVRDRLDERAARAAAAACARSCSVAGNEHPSDRHAVRQRLRRSARLLRVVHGPRQGGELPRRGGLVHNRPVPANSLVRRRACARCRARVWCRAGRRRQALLGVDWMYSLRASLRRACAGSRRTDCSRIAAGSEEEKAGVELAGVGSMPSVYEKPRRRTWCPCCWQARRAECARPVGITRAPVSSCLAPRSTVDRARSCPVSGAPLWT